MLEEKLDVLVVADVIDEDTKKYIEGNCLDDNYIEKYKIGDIDERRGKVRNSCSWLCYTAKKECVFTSDALKDLYEILKANFGDIKKRISALKLNVNIDIMIDATEKDDVYSIDFSKEMLKMCAELNADVCVDGIYY